MFSSGSTKPRAGSPRRQRKARVESCAERSGINDPSLEMIVRPIYAVIEREVLKLFRQRSRLLSAMVRPLIWLFVIGAGLDAMLNRAGETSYQYFLVPGVVGMAMLFGAMLAALATVYDKE